MTASEIATWSEIAASVAVLVTLVYLAIQIRQQTAAVRAASRQSLLEVHQNQLYKLVDTPGIFASISDTEELTQEQTIQFHYWMAAALRSAEHEWLQYQSGALDEDTWAAYQSVVPFLLRTHRTRDWWKVVGRKIYHPGFVKLIEDATADQPETSIYKEILELGKRKA